MIVISPLVSFVIRNVLFAISTALGTYIHWQINLKKQEDAAASNGLPFDRKVFGEKEKTAKNMDIAANILIQIMYSSILYNYNGQGWPLWLFPILYLVGASIGYGGSAFIIKFFGKTQNWISDFADKQTGQKDEDVEKPQTFGDGPGTTPPGQGPGKPPTP